ncbi:MAG: phosphatidylglycerophosphatase A [Candidatus Acidiferrum sp.]|jgi:phosphatidylglycerophosphatase A
MLPDTEPGDLPAPAQKKSPISFLLATCFGAGYLPKAPGTWGSLAGLILTAAAELAARCAARSTVHWPYLPSAFSYWSVLIGCCALTAALGVWSSSRVASSARHADPQFVVIDEISGQMLTFVAGVPDSASSSTWRIFEPVQVFGFSFEWQILVAGFLLFRLFDIWKPFPIRRLEKLPGGWGIMADDWMAGIYAAILLRLALHFNLL